MSNPSPWATGYLHTTKITISFRFVSNSMSIRARARTTDLFLLTMIKYFITNWTNLFLHTYIYTRNPFKQ